MSDISQPTILTEARLKRLGRYLVGHQGLQFVYDYQPEQNMIVAYSDSDWAGDRVSRKSTSATAELHGSHTIETTSTTQSTIALSTGEAEFYALQRAGAGGLQTRHLLEAFGLSYSVEVRSDASAGIGIASRSGGGRLRHLEAKDLWVQEKVRQKQLVLRKCDTVDNPSDLMTKYIESPSRIDHLLELLSLRYVEVCDN